MDLDWHAMPQLQGAKLTQPIAFISGLDDMVIKWFGGAEGVRAVLPQHCVTAPDIHFLEQTGHWLQQEAPERVNELLLRFLDTHRGLLGQRRRSRL
jgi:pimeloyl-ACP methyl ester carboxylesterase